MARNEVSNQAGNTARVAPLEHHSRGGNVKRHTGNFTRGSQLIGHKLFLWKSGALIPVYLWLGCGRDGIAQLPQLPHIPISTKNNGRSIADPDR